MVINEDIIKRALDESIEEFMINEANWGKAFDNAWNGVKNAAAMYMDWRTNGQWNKKYNIHAKGNGNTIGSYYLNKWFQTHYYKLQDIVYGEYYGNRLCFYMPINGKDRPFTHNWQDKSYIIDDDYYNLIYRLKIDEYNIPTILSIEDYKGNEISGSTAITHNSNDNSYEAEFQNGSKIKLSCGEDNTTPEAYIANNCNANSFIKYTQNTLGDGNFKTMAINYINAIQQKNQNNINELRKNPKAKINYKEIISFFTIAKFYEWCSKQTNVNQQQQQSTQPINNVNQQSQYVGKKDPNYKGSGNINLKTGKNFNNN